MTIFIIVWTVISAPALIYNIYKMYDIDVTWDVLLYPRLHRLWIEKELTGAWIMVMDIFYTIIFLPAVVFYFIVMLSMLMFAFIVYGINVGISKWKKRKK